MELPDRSQLDDDAAALLIQMSDRHRAELESLLGNPPLWENVPQTWWRKLEREVTEQAALVLLVVYIASGEFHGIDAGTAERGGRGWAATNGSRIAQGYVATTQDRIRQSTDDWLRRMLVEGEQITHAEIHNRVRDVLSEQRQRGLATDLVTTAQTAGGEAAIDALGGLSDDDTWKTNPGHSKSGPCEICGPLHGAKRPEWSAEFPMGPPGPHPGCVCEIVYAVALAGVA